METRNKPQRFGVSALVHAVALLAMGALCSCARGERQLTSMDYGDAAHDALRHQQYDVALKQFLLAARRAEIESPSPWKRIPRSIYYYSGKVNVYSAQGLYAKAIELENKWYDFWSPENQSDKNRLSEHSYHYAKVGDLCLAQGKWEEALSAYNKAGELQTEFQRHSTPYNPGSEVQYDRQLGELYVQLGDYEMALQHFQAQLDRFIARGSMRADHYGAASYRVARAHYYADNLEQAGALAKQAAKAPNPFGAYSEHEANTALLLAKIAEREGKPKESILQYYQDMITYLEPDGDSVRTLRAEIYREIGRFQLKHDDFVEAQAAYSEAARLHRETATTTHPDCADAIKGLADVSAAEGELTSATLYAEEALKILDNSVVPTHPRIAAELIALASIHVLAGLSEQAAPLNERIETILQKPLGPWKEDFLDTTAFYADLLENNDNDR
jgi:tetratricopeptide (TPR) repeat protein